MEGLLSGYSSEEDDQPVSASRAFRQHFELAQKNPEQQLIKLGPERPTVDPKDVLAVASPQEAQALAPLYGPLADGQNRPGGLYRKFRNHEMGHLQHVSREEAEKLASQHSNSSQKGALTLAEISAQDELAEKHGFNLTKVTKKRLRNDDPSSADYLGPWAPYEGELERRAELRTMSKELNAAQPEIVLTPPKPEKVVNERPTTFHIKDFTDYQGRSWILPKPLVDPVAPGPDDEPSNYTLPSKVIHTYSGHSKGINRIRWFPKSAHLLLSASVDGTCKIWSVDAPRRCIATYAAHAKAVKDVNFTTDGTKFYSASFDTTVRLWDTEYGKVISTFGNEHLPFCVSVHPDPSQQNIVVCASQNKKAVQYDANTGDIVQEYNEHLAAVNSVTFCEDGHKLITTADDKKMFVWEFGIGVVVKHIAEPYMHAMPAVQLDPYGRYLACQSMDNQIVVYEGRGRFRLQSRKRFRGHLCTGYSILPGFSPDAAFLISGDSSGRCWFWDWKTSKVHRSLIAHDGVCMTAIWHPHRRSLVATCGWDGLIKLWA